MKYSFLEAVYREYQKDVYRYLLFLSKDPYTAEDLAQETFCRALVHMDKMQDGKVKPWLFRVAYHAFIDKTRKESRMQIYDTDYFQVMPDSNTPETHLMGAESRKELDHMLAELSPEQREAVTLYDIQGYSYKEAADLMGVKLSRYKIVLYRARQRLKQDKVSKKAGRRYSEVI
ncbi:RNA polymerase subunit sigma-24 [Paenibacillus sp. CAA11]|uniref:sigma-70 family RNA polymerase sigma factor n=1 Tax=Paenibacillus sp. CAA11 TaxID=1532905 RepID=UPI000D33CF14|nr:sigma-70 family RNA polymerase sigma factor [Paenibacillus sp. CAA11]AWB44441.1 RNA polymerase subunit sigma-24 [Paenibacillus sp. CAA11]